MEKLPHDVLVLLLNYLDLPSISNFIASFTKARSAFELHKDKILKEVDLNFLVENEVNCFQVQ